MFWSRWVALLIALGCLLCAGASSAESIQLSTLVDSLSLGMELDDVTRQIPGLKPSAVPLKEGWQAYELPNPPGDLGVVKCAFASGKLEFVLLETREGGFAKAKELVEKKYGAFPQPDDHSVFELQKDGVTIRLLRTGEEGTDAQIMIGNL